MITSNTASKTSSQPLERMKTPAQKTIFNPDEQIERPVPIGYYDEEPQPQTSDVLGNIDFTELKVDPSSIVNEGPVISSIFKPGEWTTDLSVTADKVSKVASKTVKFIGNLTSEGKDAGLDLIKMVAGKDQELQTPSDPQKQEEENKKIVENQYVNQKQEEIEVAILTIHRTLEALAQQKSIRENLSNLTGLQMWLSSMLSEAGEVRDDLKDPAEKKAEELAKIRAMANSGPVTGTFKRSGRGLSKKDNFNDNLSNETKSTAQQAVG